MIAPLLATRNALAEVLAAHRVVMSYDSQDRAVAVCSCGYQAVGGSPDAHRADAVLASGVLDTVRADAWDEGRWWWFTGGESAARGANPYRAEVSP